MPIDVKDIKLFGRHHVRSSIYQLLAAIFLVATLCWVADLISDQTSAIISGTLFVLDYLAEMYDPHPDAPGPWFKSHFHRAFEFDVGDD